MNEEEYLRAELASAKKHIEYCGERVFALEAKLENAKAALERISGNELVGSWSINLARAALKQIE